jgi:hypothetical protein
MSVLTRLRSTVAADQLVAIAEMRSGDLAPEPAELDALTDCLRAPVTAVRRLAAETLAALAETDASARGRLDSALRAPDRTLRWGATYGLSRLGPAPPQSLPTLLDALGSDDGDVRWATAAILAAMEHRDAVAEQLVGVARDGSPAQRKMALYCLRDMGRSLPAIDAVLLAAFDDPDVRVRLAAITTLPRVVIDREAASRRLLAVLDEPHDSLRRAAAAALGALGLSTPTIRERLRAAAALGDASLGRAARRSLRLLEP